MKKTIILSMCCMTALTASASSGSDEVALGILSIFLVVFGVLQIILFFKVWGMTNNVKMIKDNLTQDDSLIDDSVESKVCFHLLQGDKETAKRLIITQFVKAIDEAYTEMLIQGTNPDKFFEIDLTPLVKEFKKRMQSVGMELPAEIAQLKTIGDYYNLYNPECFTFEVNDKIKVEL